MIDLPDGLSLFLRLLVAGVACSRERRASTSDSATRRNLLSDQSSISLLKASIKSPPQQKRTSFCVSTAGKDDSNPAISSGAAVAVGSDSAPPSKSSPAPAFWESATWSRAVANCSASSPRTARSRARKSSWSAPPLASVGSVWPKYLQISIIETEAYGRGLSLTSGEFLEGRETVRHFGVIVCSRRSSLMK